MFGLRLIVATAFACGFLLQGVGSIRASVLPIDAIDHGDSSVVAKIEFATSVARSSSDAGSPFSEKQGNLKKHSGTNTLSSESPVVATFGGSGNSALADFDGFTIPATVPIGWLYRNESLIMPIPPARSLLKIPITCV